ATVATTETVPSTTTAPPATDAPPTTIRSSTTDAAPTTAADPSWVIDDQVRLTVSLPADALPDERTKPLADRDRANGLYFLDGWALRSCNCRILISVQRDPGDDAPLYALIKPYDTITAESAAWRLVDMGGAGDNSHGLVVAFARREGLLYEITGDGTTVPNMIHNLTLESIS
ncbi:MAG TPA: hypothetical protein VGM78_01395, partial [Ilumatobacteraceae bacterium]